MFLNGRKNSIEKKSGSFFSSYGEILARIDLSSDSSMKQKRKLSDGDAEVRLDRNRLSQKGRFIKHTQKICRRDDLAYKNTICWKDNWSVKETIGLIIIAFVI